MAYRWTEQTPASGHGWIIVTMPSLRDLNEGRTHAEVHHCSSGHSGGGMFADDFAVLLARIPWGPGDPHDFEALRAALADALATR